MLGLPTTILTDYLNFVLLTAYRAGILLNFSGYGYRFSAERGVEIGTLAEVRSAFAEGAYTSYVLLSTCYFPLPTSNSLRTTHCLLRCAPPLRSDASRRDSWSPSDTPPGRLSTPRW